MPPEIALFSGTGCPQVEEIGQAVVREGGKPLIFRSGLGGPEAGTMSVSASALTWNGVDLSGVRALHIRCISQNTPFSMPPVTNAVQYEEFRTSFMREQLYQGAVLGFFEEFAARGGLLVNSPFGAYVDHDSKAQLYSKLKDNGFDTPQSMMTNDPQAAAAFIESVGEAVCKPSAGVGSTRAATVGDVRDSGALPLCPVLFQERIRGATLRVHVVGRTMVLALRVLAPDLDSRTATSGFEPFAMPREQAERIVAATEFMGLHYAAWDVIAADDGRYVYLDCNPGPYVMWIGEEFRRFVFCQLARYLVGYAVSGNLGEAAARVDAWEVQ